MRHLVTMDEHQAIAGDHYASLIKERLTEERARKASLEQRGTGIVTTSGILVTLVFAVATFSLGTDDPTIPSMAYWAIALGLVLLVTGGVLGILINRPRGYQEPDLPTLRELLTDEIWKADPVDGQQSAAEVMLDVISTAGHNNDKKAKLLAWGLEVELAAVVTIVVAIVAILTVGY